MSLIFCIWALLVAQICSLCSNITIGTMGYDLSNLTRIGSTSNYTFALCSPTICQNNNYQYNTRISQITTNANGTYCTPLTCNYEIKTADTELTASAFATTDNGLSITFPSIKSYESDANRTVTTKLLINCSTSNSFVSTNVTSDASTLTTVISLQSQSGCYFSIPNYFWQFLIERQLIFALFFLAVGLFQMFFGYYFIQITIFLYGWIAGSAFSLIYFAQTYPGSQSSPDSVINFMIILSCILGMFYGFLLITLPKLGYFNIGIWLGAIGTLMLQNAVLYLSKSLLTFYIVLGVVCLVLGIIAIMAFKYFIIISTSIISGFMIVRPLGFYLGYYPNEFLFYMTRSSMPWQYYLYLVSMLVLAAIGIIFQTWLYKKTGKRRNKLYHLEEEGDFKDKFKKLLEFKEIKKAIAEGKEEFNFLKTIIKKKDEHQPEPASSVNEQDLEDYNPKSKRKNGNNLRSEPQKKNISDDESDPESVEIQLVDMKGKGKNNLKKPPSKQLKNKIDSEEENNSGKSKKKVTKVVARHKK